jgi:hypothetical protein
MDRREDEEEVGNNDSECETEDRNWEDTEFDRDNSSGEQSETGEIE